MSLITLLIGICVILFALWITKTFMPAPWQTPVLVIIVLLALIWLVSVFVPGLAGIRVGR